MAIKYINNKICIGVHGSVITKQRKKGCAWKIVDEGDNIVTNQGLKNILLLLINGTGRPKYIGVGTGTSAVALTDIALETPIVGKFMDINDHIKFIDNGRNDIDDSRYTTLVNENQVLVEIRRVNVGKTYDNLNKEILSEIGLFSRYAIGDIWAHKLFSENIGVDFESDETFEWNIKICRDEIKAEGYIGNSGLDILGDLFLDDDPLYLNYPHYPRGINYGVVGRNGGLSLVDTDGVIEEVLRNELVNYCIEETNLVTDANYSVKVIVQQMIPAFSFTGTIEEAALYRVRKQFLSDGDIWGGQMFSIPFCRSTFDPVDATDDICMTWEFTIENRVEEE